MNGESAPGLPAPFVSLQPRFVGSPRPPKLPAGREAPEPPTQEPALSIRRTPMRRIMTRHVLFIASFVLLFEEWLWTWTTRALARLSRFAAIASTERWIGAQSPRASLALLLTPLLILAPFKVLAIALMYAGQATLGVTVLVADKLVVTALFARVWQLTEPAVTRIDPVRRLRDAFLRLRGALHAWLDAQPAYVEMRAIVRRYADALRRRRGVARRIRQWREARRDRPADPARPNGAIAGVSRDR